MNHLKISAFRCLIAPSLGLAALLLPGLARAAEEPGSDGLATMARAGTVFHFSDSFSIGVEATLQQVHGSRFGFPSFGSMISIDL